MEKQGTSQRAFGRVLQQVNVREFNNTRKQTRSGALDLTKYPGSPSPSKKPRHAREVKKLDKENDASHRYVKSEQFPSSSSVIPYNDNDEIAKPAAELNNSFTEKISNLGIGGGASPPSSTLFTLKAKPGKANNGWVECLDTDSDYVTEILNYWHTLELACKVDPHYMVKQSEITYRMRTILVDWIVEVVDEYNLAEATLHRAVHFVDRFLSILQISRSNLQLLGTTCLFLACKVEEVQPPDTNDLVYITDNTYDKTQLLNMEVLVLSVLEFDLLTPTCYEFTEYFSSTLQLSPTAKEFSRYVIELALLDGERYLRYPQSVMSMAACYVAIRCCGDINSSSQPATLKSTLSRVQRLNSTPEFERCVKEAAGNVYVTLVNTTHATDDASGNSVCTKYARFQDQRYLVAAASLAACSSVWC